MYRSTRDSRRVFILQLAAVGGGALALGAQAQTARVDEKDPQAVALGYSSDTTKVDVKKYAKHTNEQKCSGCQLYGGKAADPSGPCSIFPGKHVSANGWCSAWVKKAG